MKKIKLEILGLSSSIDSQSGSFALVLKETNGDRRLPIIIGMFEAQSIAMEIEKIVPDRPMTHDLFKSLSSKFNFSVTEVIITDLEEGVFFSKIFFSDSKKNVVFLLWGGFAKKKGKKINEEKHCVLTSGHPSPLSANRGYWFGNKHFSQANAYLIETGQEPIVW